MPELPEVETIARELREGGLIGLTIERAQVFWERSIDQPESPLFCRRIANQVIRDIERRGKFLVFSLSKDSLLVHLRMTGKFLIDAPPAITVAHPHERVRLHLSDQRILRYEDQRKFGKWYLTSTPEEQLAKIGVEPLSKKFTLQAFKSLIRGQKRRLKPFLLDQRFVAGLGNIYVDEALWSAQLHPLRPVNSLSDKELQQLHQAIILVLKQGIENTGTSLGTARANYFSVSGRRGDNQSRLNVFRRDGMPCARCGTIILKSVVAQRGTHFCPLCQK
jgi:formamidopyrimidine-DNA glycosylase